MVKRSEMSKARALLATKIAHTKLCVTKARQFVKLTVGEAEQILKVFDELEDVPENNRRLMVAVCEVITTGK